ncbi:SH3 domain-containing protein [Streptomyces zingiberis]|uniref:SH3 domain-containing protein n=1 Tax=Streptomyces zingiberis TaxID=2053010 RepID=A0ABX1BRI8_9ACTN|nr:SH3 domain-containing protein [Streptomyces zingiberis]NJQ00301.1 SH3 domain-containing protein [Streptomyces zingiberis]
MNSIRRVGSTCAAVALLAAGGIAVASPAVASAEGAACTTYAAKETVNIRNKPSTSGAVVGSLTKGRTVCGTVVKGDSHTACGVTSSAWVRFKENLYVAGACMKVGKTPL